MDGCGATARIPSAPRLRSRATAVRTERRLGTGTLRMLMKSPESPVACWMPRSADTVPYAVGSKLRTPMILERPLRTGRGGRRLGRSSVGVVGAKRMIGGRGAMARPADHSFGTHNAHARPPKE